MEFTTFKMISDEDMDFITEFIETFESVSLPQVKKMLSDFTEGNLDGLKKEAHQLKPTAELLEMATHATIVKINLNPEQTTTEELEAVISDAELTLSELKRVFSS